MILTESNLKKPVKINQNFNSIIEAVNDFIINSESSWHDIHIRMARLEHSCIISEEEGKLKKAASGFWEAIKRWFNKAKEFIRNVINAIKAYFSKWFTSNSSHMKRALSSLGTIKDFKEVKINKPAYITNINHDKAIAAMTKLGNTGATVVSKLSGSTGAIGNLKEYIMGLVNLGHDPINNYVNDKTSNFESKDIYGFLNYNPESTEITINKSNVANIIKNALEIGTKQSIVGMRTADKATSSIFEQGERMAAILQKSNKDDQSIADCARISKRLGTVFTACFKTFNTVLKEQASFGAYCATIVLRHQEAPVKKGENTVKESVNLNTSFSSVIDDNSLLARF